jgi:hypothetical protein
MKFAALVSFIVVGALMFAASKLIDVLSPQDVLARYHSYYMRLSGDCIQTRDNSQQVIIDNSSNTAFTNNSTNIQSC